MSWNDGRIVVTGGAGFIGSALVWALNEMGFDKILVVDLLGEGDKYQNLVPLRFEDYVEGDVFADRVKANPGAFGQVSCLLHLGACSATTETDCRYLIQNNYELTKDLAKWALGRDVRFVYASSAATYGDGAAGMDDDGALEPLRPLNMYGYSKHLFDLWAQRQGLLEDIAGMKYFNVFGPNEFHKGDMRSVVVKAHGQIRETGSVKLFKSHHPDYEDGGQMRDFLYVKDAVAMTLHLAATSSANGLFNLGSGVAHTWLDLVRPIFGAMGRDEQIEFIPMPEHLREKYQYYTCASIERLRASGYSAPITPLADAATDYVKHYLEPGAFLGDEGDGALGVSRA